MSIFSNLSALSASLLTLGLAVSTTAQTPSVQTSFPDVPPNYWAQPFIQRMAQRSIVVGYPDGTFRPEQAVQRDEFAAMIRKAFNQEQVRQIPSGSVYQDVPDGYWAEPAIEEAYQQGFMSSYPSNTFRPNQPVSRVEAIVTLVNGLNLAPKTQQTTTTAPTRRIAKKPIYFPLAITSLMQPLIVPQAKVAKAPTPPPVESQTTAVQEPVAAIVSDYYQDSQRVPKDAVDDVGIATQKNMVVNYPNPKLLNPNQPLKRATAAALIHQALVAQDRIEPLPENAEAYNYIVRPEISQQAAR
ncbi:S-layer homology domain-containing protein [Nostocaceae cyanobacterium CENA357]|uniref:S-layer homology domain-containing protein n=1 Tax=Atlanticothrix silvestris CENA357 TaxID=1725252 RepID=A0A8J7HCJ8_9CYAN|nr:S-layer homology domain-containing protein [Atlanticothrix silvestris]MBH8552839.1 S-layer homology domain-containing protein [Atlanticothrix silvestris CENA357]